MDFDLKLNLAVKKKAKFQFGFEILKPNRRGKETKYFITAPLLPILARLFYDGYERAAHRQTTCQTRHRGVWRRKAACRTEAIKLLAGAREKIWAVCRTRQPRYISQAKNAVVARANYHEALCGESKRACQKRYCLGPASRSSSKKEF